MENYKIGHSLPPKPDRWDKAQSNFDELAQDAGVKLDFGSAYWWWRKATEVAKGERRKIQFSEAADFALNAWRMRHDKTFTDR